MSSSHQNSLFMSHIAQPFLDARVTYVKHNTQALIFNRVSAQWASVVTKLWYEFYIVSFTRVFYLMY